MFQVIRTFLGEEEIEATFSTKEEAQLHIDNAKKQEKLLNLGIKSDFRIQEVR